MTKKFFWENPYLKSMETRIASVNGSNVTSKNAKNELKYTLGQKANKSLQRTLVPHAAEFNRYLLFKVIIDIYA